MANNCWYTLRVISPTKEAIDRLLQIMRYKDKEHYLYRVFIADFGDEPTLGDDGLWTATITGDVAWSCHNWIAGLTSDETRNDKGKSKLGASYSTLNDLCKEFGMGVEGWGAEMGCCFQQHFYINKFGETCINDSVDWEPSDEDGGDGYVVNDGGFGDEYETWLPNEYYKKEATETVKSV